MNATATRTHRTTVGCNDTAAYTYCWTCTCGAVGDTVDTPHDARSAAATHLAANVTVGMGATMHYPSDSYGYAVAAVSASGKTITLVRMPHPSSYGVKGGDDYVVSHTYTDEQIAGVLGMQATQTGRVATTTARRSTDGRFYVGGKSGRPVVIGSAYFRRNYMD